MSAGTSNTAFHTLDNAGKLRDNDVSVARVGGKLFAFDDIYEGYPLSGGLLTGTDRHRPARAGDGGAQDVRRA